MQNISFFSASILTQGNSFFHVGWNFRAFFIFFHRFYYFFNNHKTCHNGNCIVHLVSNEVVISIYGMWIPVIETTEPDILGKQKRKRESCREKKPNFAKLRLVYNVQNAWELRPQWKRTSFLGKLYSSRRTSAFGNPLVRDTRVLVSDGRTSGSFLP